MKDKLFNPQIDEDSDMIVLGEDMYNPILNSMLNNLGWKDDEYDPMTIKAEVVKKAIGSSTHITNLSTSDLSSTIPIAT